MYSLNGKNNISYDVIRYKPIIGTANAKISLIYNKGVLTYMAKHVRCCEYGFGEYEIMVNNSPHAYEN